MGSGTVGRVVAYDNRDPWFESLEKKAYSRRIKSKVSSLGNFRKSQTST